MSEIKYGRLGLDGSEHWKCNHLMTLGFKGIIVTVDHLSGCFHSSITQTQYAEFPLDGVNYLLPLNVGLQIH